MSGQALKGHLELLLLSVIGEDALHGYGVIRRLRERSGGSFDLPEGTVYPALKRLEQAKRLRSRWEVVDGRRRRVYSRTAAGKRAVKAELSSWIDFREAMTMVVGAGA